MFADVPQQDRPTTMELFARLLNLRNPASALIPEVKVEDELLSPASDETVVEDHTLQEFLNAADASARMDAQGAPRIAKDGTKPASIVLKDGDTFVRATSQLHNPHPPPQQTPLEAFGVPVETQGLQRFFGEKEDRPTAAADHAASARLRSMGSSSAGESVGFDAAVMDTGTIDDQLYEPSPVASMSSVEPSAPKGAIWETVASTCIDPIAQAY